MTEWREALPPAAIDFGRDVRHRSAFRHLQANGIRIIAPVAFDYFTIRQLLDARRGGGAVNDLTSCQEESDGAALSIRQRLAFRCPAAARPTYRLALFRPARSSPP